MGPDEGQRRGTIDFLGGPARPVHGGREKRQEALCPERTFAEDRFALAYPDSISVVGCSAFRLVRWRLSDSTRCSLAPVKFRGTRLPGSDAETP